LSAALYVAAKLGIAVLLADGAKGSEDLAQATGTHPHSLYRVLRLLASQGVFAEVESRRFALTPLATLLRADVPGSLRALAIRTGGLDWRPWGALLHSVRTGTPAFDHVYGMSLFAYLAQDAEAAQVFNDTMTMFTQRNTAAVVGAYDFSAVGTIVDVGGGHGALMAAILEASPRTRGILVDLPAVIEGARRQITARGLHPRCELVAGDFFESVPVGGDAYILKWIIHDWDDERAITILRNCHRAMVPGGRLLLVEALIPFDNEPHFGKSADVTMLAFTGGMERTEAEYRVLLDSAGFVLTRIIPTDSHSSVLEGRKA
jgi:ubiquinone/menaquinone biosynthesis C-methylase UbiE